MIVMCPHNLLCGTQEQRYDLLYYYTIILYSTMTKGPQYNKDISYKIICTGGLLVTSTGGPF